MVPINGKVGLSAWLGIPAAILAIGVGLFWVVGTSYVSRYTYEQTVARVNALEGEVKTIRRDMQICVALAQNADVPWAVCMAERLK